MGDFLWQSHTGTVLPSNVRTTPTGKPGQPGAPKIPNARLSQESSAVELARSLLRIVADVNPAKTLKVCMPTSATIASGSARRSVRVRTRTRRTNSTTSSTSCATWKAL